MGGVGGGEGEGEGTSASLFCEQPCSLGRTNNIDHAEERARFTEGEGEGGRGGEEEGEEARLLLRLAVAFERNRWWADGGRARAGGGIASQFRISNSIELTFTGLISQ